MQPQTGGRIYKTLPGWCGSMSMLFNRDLTPDLHLMKKQLVCFYWLMMSAGTAAQSFCEQDSSFRLPDYGNRLSVVQTGDSAKPPKVNIIKRFIRAFNAMDTTYIQPNKYNWAVMLQNTNTFESYTIKDTQAGQGITFSRNPAVKIGPYLGWRWLFFGYTFDVTAIGKAQKSTKTEFELSLYSSMLMCDLIYRYTGDDFKLRRLKGFPEEAQRYEGAHFNGIRSYMIGINGYYIFNHKRFSYPAAYAQSTVQKKSCGTWKVGMSFDLHELKFNYKELPQDIPLSNDLKFKKNKYWNLSVSAGYAYNWVFKKNCLLNISFTPAIGYTHNYGNTTIPDDTGDGNSMLFQNFNRNNFHVNFTGRLGLVWNNSKYFAGMSLIVHTFNFKHTNLFTNNTFGTLNFYVGMNFMKRKAYRNE